MTTDLQTHSLILTADTIAEYTRLEVDRIASHNGRPLGLRMSTDCPIRRVLEFTNDAYRTPIHPGVAARGHQMESLFRACCPELIGEWQVPVPWQGNTSALDFITPDGIVGELKSTTKGGGPTAANKRQIERMIEAFNDRPQPVHFYMLHAGCLEAVGPYVHDVTREALDAAKTEREAVVRAFNDIALDKLPQSRLNDGTYWRDVYGLTCRCGACTRLSEPIEADHPLERLFTQYETFRDTEKAAAAKKDAVRSQIEDACRTRLRVAGKAHGRFQAYWSRMTATISPKGAFRMTERREG